MADVTYESAYDDDPRRRDHRRRRCRTRAAYDTTEGRVYTVTGGDWDTVLAPDEGEQERVVVNMGPQHPSTHGVLRLILELQGETITEARCGIGYLHTGIEKNLEYRTWTQAVAYVTRMDYLAPIANEAGYCLARREAARHRRRRARRARSSCASSPSSSTASPRTSSRSPPAASRWARSPR